MGLRKGIGQTLAPVETPVAAPPSAPIRPGSTAYPVDEKTRKELLEIILASKVDRNRIAAWWQSTPNAREVLGDKLASYQQYLMTVESYIPLADTLEYRLSSGPGVYIKGNELDDLKRYQEAVQNLVMTVEGKAEVAEEPPVPGSPKSIALPGGVAAASFITALLI